MRTSNVVRTLLLLLLGVLAARHVHGARKRKRKRGEEKAEEGTCDAGGSSKNGGRCLFSGTYRGLEGLALDICSWQEIEDRCAPSLHVFDGSATADPLNATTFFHYVRAGIPFVVRGDPREEHAWATEKESLIEAFGKSFVSRVNVLPDGLMGYAYFDEMLQNTSETPFYAPQSSCDEIKDAAARDSLRPSGLSALVFGEKSNACNLWIGAHLDETNHGHTLLHIDHTHNIYTQVAGTKTFDLLPPYAREALIPFRHANGVMMSEARVRGTGWVNGGTLAEGPRLYRFKDGARFTHFGSYLSMVEDDGTRKAFDMYHNFPNVRRRTKRMRAEAVTDAFLEKHGMRVTLEPGDTLYLPPYWYHEVRSFGELSVSYNHWWNAAGWMRRVMKKLDNVASAMFQMSLPWSPPGSHYQIEEVLPPKAYRYTCEYRKPPKKGERVWPCQLRRDPGNPDTGNLQSILREACAGARDCDVTDMRELLLETPTWKQAFARANPQYLEGMEQAGVLRDWPRKLA